MVALDVEWTKNYKIKNGSRPFCYSLVLLHWPEDGGDLKLDVMQPELARGSMTKLQRDFLATGSEQLPTLKVRHSLSTALVTCLGLGLVGTAALNVNQLVHQEMWDLVAYVRSKQFEPLP